MNSLKGLFRYVTFGLRQEWLDLFFENGLSVFTHPSLGPKQHEALYRYLQDAELVVNKQVFTKIHRELCSLYQKNPNNHGLIWSIVWINLCFNASLFAWWISLPNGKYSRETTIDTLSKAYGKRNSSVVGAYTSLISSFERTPIGSDLRIGQVTKQGRARTIQKQGGHQFSPVAALYAVYKYAERSQNYRIELERIADEPLSPQKIFLASTQNIHTWLSALFRPEFLKIEFNDEQVIFVLNPQKSSLDVLQSEH